MILLYLGLVKSNAKDIYKKSHEKVEKWSKIMFSAMMKITLPCMMVSILIAGYVMYFTTDTGAESFQLLSFAWLDHFPFLCEIIGFFFILLSCDDDE